MPVLPDGQGRITIPAQLLKEAGVEKEVVLVAQESRIEIWPLASYERMESEAKAEGIENVLETVFAEEESELASLRRTLRPDGEGNPLAGSR